MIIKKITIHGFKSIYDETEFIFDKDNICTGLWKVSGQVGVGKTTLGEAILWCLYGSVKDKTNAELISWGAKKCEGTIEMISNGHDITVHRLMKRQGQGEMDIFIDGTPLEYTDKRNGQQILESEYYDVSRIAVETLCVISFNNFKSIAQMSAGSKESRQFIDDVFGFGVVKNYISATKEEVSKRSNELISISAVIGSLETEKENIENNISKYKRMIDVPSDEEIGIRQDISSLQQKLSEFESKTLIEIESQKKYLTSLSSKMTISTSEGKMLKSNIDKISGGRCPVCGSEVDISIIDSYKEKLNELRSEYKVLKSEYDEKTKELNNYIREMGEEKTKYNDSISVLKKKLQEISIHKTMEISSMEDRIKVLNERIKEEKEKKLSIDVDVSGWKELYDILYNNSRSLLMKHYIGPLNNNINYYMQELQQPYMIHFDERFVCTIDAFGERGISIRSLSTGQEKIVNTAIIFGILKTLLNGVNFNIIFLDELTSNMHDDLRDLTCEMLQRNIKDKCIFIISHAPIDDNPFEGEIKVKLSPREENDHLIHNSTYNISHYNGE